MAQKKKDTSLRKAILQAAVTGKLISEVKEQGGESLPPRSQAKSLHESFLQAGRFSTLCWLVRYPFA